MAKSVVPQKTAGSLAYGIYDTFKLVVTHLCLMIVPFSTVSDMALCYSGNNVIASRIPVSIY